MSDRLLVRELRSRRGPARRVRRMSTLQSAIVVLLLVDGGIHLALAPEHLSESPILGVGFVLSGLAQCAMAGMFARAQTWIACLFAAVLSVTSIAVYGVAITTGLGSPSMASSTMPAAMHRHPAVDSGEPSMSAAEPITPLGVGSKLMEVATLVLVVGSQMRASGVGRSSRTVPARA